MPLKPIRSQGTNTRTILKISKAQFPPGLANILNGVKFLFLANYIGTQPILMKSIARE